MLILPPPDFFITRTLSLISLTTSTVSVKNEESKKTRHTLEEEEYVKCSETEIIRVIGGFVTFTNNFKYLRSYISYSLWDDYYIDTHLEAGNTSMVALAKFCTDDSVDNLSKYLIFLAIPINLLLRGCESWELRTSLLKSLRYFYTAASNSY